MHLARGIGYLHGQLAKTLLVQLALPTEPAGARRWPRRSFAARLLAGRLRPRRRRTRRNRPRHRQRRPRTAASCMPAGRTASAARAAAGRDRRRDRLGRPTTRTAAAACARRATACACSTRARRRRRRAAADRLRARAAAAGRVGAQRAGQPDAGPRRHGPVLRDAGRRQVRVRRGPPGARRRGAEPYRLEGRGYCTQPARALGGDGAVLVSRFDVVAIVRARGASSASRAR